MTPEKRERYIKWHKARPAGSQGRRNAIREERRQAEEVRAVLARPRRETLDPEDVAIAEAIALARRHLELLEQREREHEFWMEFFK